MNFRKEKEPEEKINTALPDSQSVHPMPASDKKAYARQRDADNLDKRQGLSFIGRSLVAVLIVLLVVYVGLQTFFLLHNRFYALNQAHSAYIAGTAYVAFGGDSFDAEDADHFYITDYKKLYEHYNPDIKGMVKVAVAKDSRKVLYASWTKTEKRQLIDYFWRGYALWPKDGP